MPDDGQQVDAEFVHTRGDLADGLRGVGVEGDAVLACDVGDLGDRLDGADLVVGVHDGDEDGAGLDRAGDVVGVDQAVAVDRQDGQPVPEPLDEVLAGVEDGRVLDGSR